MKTYNTFEKFCKNHTRTRYWTYTGIVFAPSNQQTLANKILSTNLKQFSRRIKSPLSR